jgi:hypothetical protein
MPMFMHYEGIDGDVSRDADRGFATGHTLVHVEAAGGGANEMFLDDTAGDASNVEIMVKVLDGRPLVPVHIEHVGWMLM